MSVRNGHEARANRQDTATQLQVERETRSPQEQLAALDARLGAGEGAQRERARLEGGLTTKQKRARR
jgi:hypothetical protein